MRVTKNVIAHADSEALTLHASVTIPDLVPLNRDFNSLDVIGRAVLHQDEDKPGTVLVDIHVDEMLPGVDLTNPVVMLGHNGTNLFLSEDGTTYAMGGYIADATLLTPEGLARMQGSEAKPVESIIPEPPEPEAI